MAFSLMPKEDVFFTLFDQQTDLVCETASTFLDLVKNWDSKSPKIAKLQDLEHEADIGTHELFSKLNRTFVTPIDREDIHELTNELDDIIDLIQSIASRMSLYKIHAIPKELIDLVEVLEESARTVKKAVSSLRDMKRFSRILDYCIEINRLE
ncbi:MAG: DUF47 family protein, partial [Elusimicrobia bacterium]|nr:DUF47 family protein [Elusimicrobiota bacterium]